MPTGIRPSLAFTPRAGHLPHAHKMRERCPATTPSLAEAAGPVDVGQHGQALLEGRVLGDADLRAEVLGSALDGGLCTASDLGLVHERGRLVGLRGQVSVDPGVAVLGFLRACAREDDAVQDAA